LCIPLIIYAFIAKWYTGDFPVFSDIADSVRQTHLYTGIGYWRASTYTKTIPSNVVRVVASIIDGASFFMLIWGIICFIKLLRYYYRDELFSTNTLALYSKMSRIIFAWTLYNPLKFILLSAVTTLANHTGHQVIAISITSNDVVYIVIAGFFVLINSLMHAAYKLKYEQDLTV
jgi:hypothetical protein